MSSLSRPALALAALALLALSSCVRPFGRQYEYEEEVYIDLDGSATVIVNSSMAALAALHGLDVPLDLTAPVDREHIRSLYESPVASVTRVSRPWRRDNRRFVQIRLDVPDIRRLPESAPFAWAKYRFVQADETLEFVQELGPSAGKPVGDVGWELWETVHRIEKGGNYGWSAMEGPQPIKPELAGPTPILPALIELPHTLGSSVTGGFVYRGCKFPELRGAYVFGDLWLSQVTKHMKTEEVAATVMTTVIDRPQRDLALVDGGSKTFSSDVTPDRVSAASDDGRDIRVTRLSEEQGFVTGTEVSQLSVEERVRFIPAHICPVVNLTDELVVVRGEQVIDHWDVVARGKVQ